MQRQRKMTSKQRHQCVEWGLHKLVSKDNNIDFTHLLAEQFLILVDSQCFFLNFSVAFPWFTESFFVLFLLPKLQPRN